LAELSQQDRNKIARRILQLRDACASEVTEELYAQPAACSVQHGDDGRQHCRNDLAFHVQFLAASVETNSLRMFRQYLNWCDGLLASRGVQCERAAITAGRLANRLSQMLVPSDARALSEFFAGDDSGESDLLEEDGANLPGRLQVAREAYVAALLAGERSAALTVAEQCLREGFALDEVYVEVLAAALHRIGTLWETNCITVAHEHVATAITQMVIAALYPRLESKGASRGRVVVTGVPGEMHQVGASLLAAALEAKRWSVTFLGSNLPIRALLDIVATSRADYLCISTTLAVHLPYAAELIQQVRVRFGSEAPQILVGGTAFVHAPASYVAELGVSRADLRGALRLLCPEELEPTAA
jgi:methanogenic corrinoid protein MtbC1